MPVTALVVALDLLPVSAHVAGGLGLALAEHVRVPANQLDGDPVGHVAQVAGARLGAQQRQEEALEQQIAQLVDQLRPGAAGSAASAVSYASSIVCGTIVATVCSRSQGQSLRSRTVNCCSPTSASRQEHRRESVARRHRLIPGSLGPQPSQPRPRRGDHR